MSWHFFYKQSVDIYIKLFGACVQIIIKYRLSCLHSVASIYSLFGEASLHSHHICITECTTAQQLHKHCY